MDKEFAVSIDEGSCINCGICMDVCPIRALDMTRTPAAAGAGSSTGRSAAGPARDWMMDVPVQVAHCNGCTICVRECPTEAISIAKAGGQPEFAPSQGPMFEEPRGEEGRWMPLSSYTRAGAKIQGAREAHDPWGKDLRWRVAQRVAPWQVWRTWTAPKEPGPAKGKE